jgi:hypothetical protein
MMLVAGRQWSRRRELTRRGSGGRQPGGGWLLPSLLRLSMAAGTANAGWPSGRFPCRRSPALVAGLASTLARLQNGDQGGRFLRPPQEMVGLAAICAGDRRPGGIPDRKRHGRLEIGRRISRPQARCGSGDPHHF